MANSIKVATCNISGLRLKSKRQSVFNWLRQLNYDIIFLQETHCHLKQEVHKWSREWDSQCFWSRGTNRSRGVAVLFNRKQVYDIRNDIIDNNGRYIIFDLYINETKYKFINIYAPNCEYQRVQFINNINTWIEPEVETLVSGDFNCTFDNDLDRKNCTGNNDVGQVDLKELLKNQHLEDVWRRRCPDDRVFSWSRGNKASRIDYWLISESLDNQVENVNYFPCIFSDHKIVTLELRTSETKHGKGVWKMNLSCVQSELFKKSFRPIWENWKKQKYKYENKNIWWDLGKHKIKNLAKWCSYKLKEDKMDKVKTLERQITDLEKNESDYNTNKLIKTKKDLEKILYEKAEGAKIRSRVNWFEHGEKSSKYFHGLEKRNAKAKAWDKILDRDKNVLTGTSNIQKVQVEFYESLYQTQSIDKDKAEMFTETIDKKVSQDSKMNLNKDISLEEALKALTKMKRNKSPGPDGIIVEFYQIYWEIIKEDLIEGFEYSFETEELSHTQYLAVIKLLYKKGIREDITNWRPISLINVDSKLLSKILAERLKLVLPEIIHTDQKGCIKGRFIGQNIRLVEDILDRYDEDEVILLLDQQKAFDRVEWDWLYCVMERFNLGDNFIKWIKIMYCNMKSAIVTNGCTSKYFSISRGIRQGDSLSALLYVLQIEPLAGYIRKCDEITGISLGDENQSRHESKIALYVDDASILLKHFRDVDKILHIVDDFGLASGSKLNKDKTIGLITNKRNMNFRSDFQITMGPVEVLGAVVGKNVDKDKYWESIIEKIKRIIAPWKIRNLSLIGKIHIVKSLGLSKVLYGCEMISIDNKFIKEIMDIVWEFIWEGKKCYVSKEVCKLPRDKGGIGMPDLLIIVKVKRVKMLINILKAQADEPWSILPRMYVRCLDLKYGMDYFALRVDDASIDIKESSIPVYYKDCLMYFQEMCKKGKDKQEVESEILWCNSKFQFRGEAFRFKHWAKSGILFLTDLVENEKIKENYIQNKVRQKAGLTFELYSIKKNLPKEWWKAKEKTVNMVNKHSDLDSILNTTFVVPMIGKKKLLELTSGDMYKLFMSTNQIVVKPVMYWKNKFMDIEIDFDKWYTCNFMNKLSPRKCIDFNWRIFHGQVNTESKLKKMNFSDGMCKLCMEFNENVEHIIIDCQHVKGIWQNIETLISVILESDTELTRFNIMAGYLIDGFNYGIVNMMLSVARWLIWKRRCIFKYDGKYINIIGLEKWIQQEISEHINVLMLSSCVKNKELLEFMKHNLTSKTHL